MNIYLGEKKKLKNKTDYTWTFNTPTFPNIENWNDFLREFVADNVSWESYWNNFEIYCTPTTTTTTSVDVQDNYNIGWRYMTDNYRMWNLNIIDQGE